MELCIATCRRAKPQARKTAMRWPRLPLTALAQRYTDYSAECYAILREPNVWSAIERVAAKLTERGKLSAAEALEAIGGDAAKLHP